MKYFFSICVFVFAIVGFANSEQKTKSELLSQEEPAETLQKAGTTKAKVQTVNESQPQPSYKKVHIVAFPLGSSFNTNIEASISSSGSTLVSEEDGQASSAQSLDVIYRFAKWHGMGLSFSNVDFEFKDGSSADQQRILTLNYRSFCCQLSPQLNTWFGAGLGLGIVDFTDIESTSGTVTVQRTKSQLTGGVVNLHAGFDLKLTPSLAFTTGVRFSTLTYEEIFRVEDNGEDLDDVNVDVTKSWYEYMIGLKVLL